MTFNPEFCRTEGDVESKLIAQYLLPNLGYSPETWYQEVAFGSIRLDFMAFAAQVLPIELRTLSAIGLAIEAKSPQRNLDPYVRRLKQYLTRLRINYGVLTNGKEFRIYERYGDRLQIVFTCRGQDITSRIEEIRSIIGSSAIGEKMRRDRVARELGYKKKGNIPMQVIAIYHNKGGVGKTTVSVNLAAALRQKGYNVLLIDLDSQANSTFATGLVKFQFEEDDNLKDNNVYHVLESSEFNLISDVARQSNFFNTPEIDVVPSHISLIQGQYRLNQIKASQTRLIKKLRQEEGKYDYVIIDTPPSRDLYAQVAIIAADHLIIPSDLRPFANQGLSSVRDFIKEIDEFRESLGKLPIHLLGVLPSKISTNARSFENTFPRQKSTVETHYDLPVLESIIFERAALSHCVNKTIVVGDLEVPDPKSIFDYAQKNAIANQSAEEFEKLAAEVLKKVEEI